MRTVDEARGGPQWDIGVKLLWGGGGEVTDSAVHLDVHVHGSRPVHRARVSVLMPVFQEMGGAW
eukprot:6059880-Pyramimonas_sp.AAC.1